MPTNSAAEETEIPKEEREEAAEAEGATGQPMPLAIYTFVAAASECHGATDDPGRISMIVSACACD